MSNFKNGYWTIKEIGCVTAIMLLTLISKEWIITVLEKIYPLTSAVPNENYLVQIGLCLVIVIIYVINWKKFVQSSQIGFSHRTGLLIAAYVIFHFFRGSNEIDFFHCQGWLFSYIGVCFIVAAIIEIIIIIVAKCDKEKTLNLQDGVIPLVYDSPTKTDALNRTKHAKVLVNKVATTLSDKNIDSSFCILLNEQYGAGKSSFFNLLKIESDNIGLTCMEFRPWLSSSSASLLADFILLLEKELRLVDRNLADGLRSYAKIVSEIHISSVELVLNDGLKLQSITQRREDLANMMGELKKPIMVLVDDVDRLDSDELLSLFKLIRNTADFPYLCYVLAADKDSLTENIKGKIVDTDLYMRKFFNLELTFPPEDNDLMVLLTEKIEGLLKQYGVNENDAVSYTQEVLKLESLIDVFCNPRDIYRYINLVSYSLDIMKEYDTLDEVNKLDVLLISLIQFISPQWYKVLRDRNDKLLSYSNGNGRFHIVNEKLSAFYTKSTLELRKAAERKRPSVTNEKNDISLDDIIEDVKKTPLNAMKGIMFELFGSSNNYKSQERICYKNEYFKYFAGHYREYEVSSAEVFSLMTSSYDDYTRAISSLKSLKQADSFVHKVLLYVEEKKYGNRVDVLKRIILLGDKVFSFNSKMTAYNLYPNSGLELVVSRLFMQSEEVKEIMEDIAVEKKEFMDFISKDDRYDYLPLILSTFSVSDDIHFIYGDKLVVRFREELIDRFVNEKLKTNPFNNNTLKFIPYLKYMYPVYWSEQFRKFIINYSYPMEWIYRFVTIKNNGKIVWDKNYAMAVCEGVTEIDSFVLNLNIQIPPEVYMDIKALKSTSNISGVTVMNHPFLSAALDWRRSNKMNN